MLAMESLHLSYEDGDGTAFGVGVVSPDHDGFQPTSPVPGDELMIGLIGSLLLLKPEVVLPVVLRGGL